jgi:hypothetical protein
MTHLPTPAIADRVARLLHTVPVTWTPVAGGYTAASRWIVTGADGSTAFVKAGANPNTAEWLRAEWRIYGAITADWLPALRGWEDGDPPVLMLEDLSRAHWPPPWTRTQVDGVLAALAAVARTAVPEGLPPAESQRDDLAGWVKVAQDPMPFLNLGLCSAAWLDSALPTLVAASAAADLRGESLLHLDVRGDNLCFVGQRVVLVDWNWACQGNARLDIAAWLPSLAAEGGPLPDEILPGEPALAALMSGFFAYHAGLAAKGEVSPRLRALQLVQLRMALPWAARALGLAAPDRNGLPG